MARRIFAERAAGTTIRQICRQLNAGAVPTPTGSRAVWGTSTLDRMLRNEAYIGRTYFNRTEAVPARKPGQHSRQVPRPRADWIAISCPAVIADETFEAAGKVSTDNTKWSPRRAEPGAWLLRGLVKCGPCGVGTSCHKMRGRNGTWHRYYYCHNHDPLRAGGQDRRCPERNIRADALDEFVFGQVRAALLDPGLLLAGEQAIAVHAPVPDDQLLAAELARLDRKLEAARGEHRRLVNLYQAGLIDMPELHRRAAAITTRQRELDHKRTSLAAERADLARGNRLRHGVESFATRVRAVIDQLDPAQRQNLLRLLIEDVQVTGWHVKIRLRIPLDDPPDGDHTHRRTPQPGPTRTPASSGAPPVSTEDRLRSLHGGGVSVMRIVGVKGHHQAGRADVPGAPAGEPLRPGLGHPERVGLVAVPVVDVPAEMGVHRFEPAIRRPPVPRAVPRLVTTHLTSMPARPAGCRAPAFKTPPRAAADSGQMRFDTKIAIAVRSDLAVWQKLNVTAFLASGIAAGIGEVAGKPYEDGSGHRYLEMFRQPVLVYTGPADTLATVRQRAVAREMPAAVYTEELFATGDDDANRAAVRAVAAESLVLAGVAVYGPRNAVEQGLPRPHPAPLASPAGPGRQRPGPGGPV